MSSATLWLANYKQIGESEMQIWRQLLIGINRSFRIRLIISLSAIILLAFGITGYLTYQYNLKLFEEEISKQFSRTNEEALAKIEMKVQEIVRVSQTVVFNPQIEMLIKRINSQEDSDAFNLYYDKNKSKSRFSKSNQTRLILQGCICMT